MSRNTDVATLDTRGGKRSLWLALLAFAGSGVFAIAGRGIAGMSGTLPAAFGNLLLAGAVVLAVVGILCVPAAIRYLRASNQAG